MAIKNKYKCLISIFMLTTLLYIPKACSEILDGGEIQFKGIVSDEGPKWTWQVSSPEQSWGVDIADAHKKYGTLVFDLRNKGALPFLEGHLYEVIERGGPGFTPIITFSSAGQPFSVKEGGTTTAQRFRASVTVHNPENGNVVGDLFFTLEQGIAVSAGTQEDGASLPGGMSLVGGKSVTDVQSGMLRHELKNRLSSLLLMNKGFGKGMSAVDNRNVINQDVLADERAINLAAAYASSIYDFELHLYAEDIPSQWQAALNVTVTVQ
ncbi:TPA: fimbrial protein [Escherichia coli]|nr:fimbrial protein [Escherichia coli]HCQ0091574.1 fimbrial protein [Escherichia coli]